jgi:alpha-amylase
MERDITAWRGNRMQEQAFDICYDLGKEVKWQQDGALLDAWRRLQTSDHFYYMCTKWFADGDVHAYFSPYASPYDGFVNYMNVLRDFREQVVSRAGGRQVKRVVAG